jgi:hypothetical protein
MSNSFRFFGEPPKIGILLFSNTIKVCVASPSRGCICSLFPCNVTMRPICCPKKKKQKKKKHYTSLSLCPHFPKKAFIYIYIYSNGCMVMPPKIDVHCWMQRCDHRGRPISGSQIVSAFSPPLCKDEQKRYHNGF